MRLIGEEDGRVLIANVTSAEGTWARMKGLLGSAGLAPDEGLFIPECASIHTFFMRFPIDVVFLDGDLCVRRVVPRLPPWRLASSFGARHVVELAAGAAASAGLAEGVRVVLKA